MASILSLCPELLKSVLSRLCTAVGLLVWCLQHTESSLQEPGLIYCLLPALPSPQHRVSFYKVGLIRPPANDTLWAQHLLPTLPPTTPSEAPATLASPLFSAAQPPPPHCPAWVRAPASKFPYSLLCFLQVQFSLLLNCRSMKALCLPADILKQIPSI